MFHFWSIQSQFAQLQNIFRLEEIIQSKGHFIRLVYFTGFQAAAFWDSSLIWLMILSNPAMPCSPFLKSPIWYAD